MKLSPKAQELVTLTAIIILLILLIAAVSTGLIDFLEWLMES